MTREELKSYLTSTGWTKIDDEYLEFSRSTKIPSVLRPGETVFMYEVVKAYYCTSGDKVTYRCYVDGNFDKENFRNVDLEDIEVVNGRLHVLFI